jgi:predicted O-methyltransferase YrrM
VAEQTFQKLAISNIKVYNGDIQATLPSFLASQKHIDFIFFDANHQYEPTLSYFYQCLPYAHENSCFVFDDIHWSKEMEKAWETIQSHPDVTVSLDFYQVGIVFFRKGQAKEHFILR